MPLRFLVSVVTLFSISGCASMWSNLNPWSEQNRPTPTEEEQAAIDDAAYEKQKKEEEKIAVPDLRKKIWVLEFREPRSLPEVLSNEEKANLKLGKRMTRVFAELLNADRSPFLVDVEEMERVREMHGAEIQEDNMLEFLRLAASSNVSGLVVGRIDEFQIESQGDSQGIIRTQDVDLTLKVTWDLYDTLSAKKLVSTTDVVKVKERRSNLVGFSGSGIAELPKRADVVCDRMSQKIMKRMFSHLDKLGWSGRVVQLEANRILINAGKKTGVKVGEVLKVLERPREVYDPVTGQVIGFAPGRTKATLKVIQFFGLDGAVAVLQSGGGLQLGDRVELY